MRRHRLLPTPFEMEKEIERLNQQLTERTDYDSPEYYKLIEDVSALSEKFYSIDSRTYEADVEKALLSLGFQSGRFQPSDSRFQWEAGVCALSWQRCCLKTRTCYYFDEPTNHLDIDSIQWLEDSS